MKLEDLNPIKILLSDGKWYIVKPNSFQWVDVIYDEAEKDNEIIPMMTVVYAKWTNGDETFFVDSQSIEGYVI